MNASTRPRSREGTVSWPMIQMTKPPNRRLATGAPRRADPLVEIAQPCRTAALMRSSALSTRRAARAARRMTGARARQEELRVTASHSARRQVRAARRGLASLWTGRTNSQTSPRRRNLRCANQPAFRRYLDRDRDGARRWRGADARSAYVSLARLRLAQSSRSSARGRAPARQCSSGDRQHALRSRAAGARQGAAAVTARPCGQINALKRH